MEEGKCDDNNDHGNSIIINENENKERRITITKKILEKRGRKILSGSIRRASVGGGGSSSARQANTIIA